MGCVLAVWGWGDRRVLPSAFPPVPAPSARSRSQKPGPCVLQGLFPVWNWLPERFD